MKEGTIMKKILYVIFAVVTVVFTSCESKFLDINYDPNQPAADVVNNDMILPAVEMNLAATYANYLNTVGGYFCQIYAHAAGTSNYIDYSQFTMSATRSSGSYTQLYQKVLSNSNVIREKAAAAEEWGTYLAATTLRAFAFQLLVDCYGEIPYKEALDPSNLAPKFDDGQVVYEGVIAELDEALAKVAPADLVAQNFTFPGQNAEPWIQFANAQKLKMLMRMAGVKDVKEEVKKIIDGGNLPAADIKIAGCWSQEAGHESPFWAEEFSTLGGSTQINVVANLAIINTLQQVDDEGTITYADPRLASFFNANSDSKWVGNISGTNNSTSDAPFKNSDYWCNPKASFDMPVFLISLAEVEFFIAEYYARQGDAGQAKAHYEAAIAASCATAGVAGTESTVITQFPFDNANWKESIGISKWLALAGINCFEAYTEVRRLDYPTFGSVKGSDMYAGSGAQKTDAYVAGTLYTPYMVDGQIGDNKILERWPFAEAAQSRNGNTPKFQGFTTPIFWGK